ncbi:hypothetical protein Q4F19_08395 [Sphingomonas sp. BIUV-7]|uniref:Uncharacterized protein n=1 Tax=Sphingomonas natans TaxID=3063330 RepID=A0ABT8Y7V4_9SPHN|nr:hypothetical protein [Sphingomonas sp. BIUV-7]MDO6414398.1 hypothetical protein [Sphingomonas sp. BIUV-7]
MADWSDDRINPATGLVMRNNGVDSGGNLYGMAPAPFGDIAPFPAPTTESDVPFRDMPLARRLFITSFALLVVSIIVWNLLQKAIL